MKDSVSILEKDPKTLTMEELDERLRMGQTKFGYTGASNIFKKAMETYKTDQFKESRELHDYALSQRSEPTRREQDQEQIEKIHDIVTF